MNRNYIDVTLEWLKNTPPNSHEVKDSNCFIDKFGTKYIVDGKMLY